MLESSDRDPKIRRAHNLEKPREIIRSILPDNFKGVQVKIYIRIGDRTDDCVESQSYRLLKSILVLEKQRDLLNSARSHDSIGIRVRPEEDKR